MPSDTFHIIPAGQAPIPGTCCICGYDKRDLVDWRLTIEYYGAVLICVECVNELGQVEQLNFVPRAYFEEAQALIRSLTQTIQEYEGLRQRLEDGLLGVSRDFRLAFDNVEPVSVPAIQREEPTFTLGKDVVPEESGDLSPLF